MLKTQIILALAMLGLALSVPASPANAQSYQVTTGSTGLDLTNLLDRIVLTDSRSWMVNRYTPRSMRAARYLITNRGETSYTAYGEYDYTGLFGPASGWVKVAVLDGELVCLEFWDQPGVCRPPWISLSQQRFFNEMVNQSADMLTGE